MKDPACKWWSQDGTGASPPDPRTPSSQEDHVWNAGWRTLAGEGRGGSVIVDGQRKGPLAFVGGQSGGGWLPLLRLEEIRVLVCHHYHDSVEHLIGKYTPRVVGQTFRLRYL